MRRGENTVEKLIEFGILAPSGENCQPWKFKPGEKKDSLILFNCPERDQSLYNLNRYGSYAAHGALIENMAIGATFFGLGTSVSYFPRPDDPNCVAEISFSASDIEVDPLHAYISVRATNRKTYQKYVFTESDRRALLSASAGYEARIKLVSEKNEIEILARAGSANERIMLEDKSLHKFFFDHIRWTDAENEKNPNGFFVKTLELNPPQLAGFRLFSHRGIISALNLLGASKLVARDNAKVYASASAMGAIIIKEKNPLQFVLAGRALERIWLKVMQIGLSLQPVAGAIFLSHNVLPESNGKLSKEHSAMLKESVDTINRIFGVSQDENVAMMFRIGQGGEPSARSGRFPLEKFFGLDETRRN